MSQRTTGGTTRRGGSEFVRICEHLWLYIVRIYKILELFARSWAPNCPMQFSDIRSPDKGNQNHKQNVCACKVLLLPVHFRCKGPRLYADVRMSTWQVYSVILDVGWEGMGCFSISIRRLALDVEVEIEIAGLEVEIAGQVWGSDHSSFWSPIGSWWEIWTW